MKITESATSTFWKGEQGIRASVQDGASLYKVSLYVKGSQVRDYSCSCVNGNSCRGMCAHAKLVWEQWKKEQEQHSGRPVSTGHRPQSLPFGFNESDERCIALKQTLRAEIIRLIEQEGVTHFISGMALGVDMYAAEIVLGLKSSYEGITLESAIPCESQAEKWTEKQRDRYFEIASKCDKETLIQHHYTSDCMHKRNRYMVDQADFIIAVWDGRPSGTGKTVQYAQRQGKLVTIINPRTMLVE